MARKGTTKVELIQAIGKKIRKAKPQVRQLTLRGLQYKTKPELERMLKKIRVSRDGWDIRVG